MVAIHRELQAQRFPNCSTIGLSLEVTHRTVLRDVDYMRDRLRLPIEYDPHRRGYFYSEPVNEFPTLTLSEGEVVALLVAQQALAQYRGTPYEATLSDALAKLTRGLEHVVSFDFSAAHDRVSFITVGTYEPDIDLFRKLSAATLTEREVRFKYRKPGDVEAEARAVQPYHLACVRNLWYLLGHDIDRGALRTFALPRIFSLELTERRFRRPAGFSAARHFRDAFGIYAGDGRVQSVVLRFDAHAAALIRERHWHVTQRFRERKDGGVDLTLRLAHLEDVEGWILGWGAHVRVLKPVALAEHIHATARAMVKAYT